MGSGPPRVPCLAISSSFPKSFRARFRVDPTIVGLLDIGYAFILHDTCRNSSR